MHGQSTWPIIRGAPKWLLVLNDSRHFMFSDLPLIMPKLDLNLGQLPGNESVLTDADAVRIEEVIVTYTVAFFDHAFNGRTIRVLECKSADWPETSSDTVYLGRNGANNNTSTESTSDGEKEPFYYTIAGAGKTVAIVWFAFPLF